ncbi:MAG: type I phosphomannose isomerase catalytic subunit [Polyangiales bacterium]
MWDKVGPKNWRRPLLLRADNFTPPERTPWGGRWIAQDLKSDLDLGRTEVVGESWELSVEPDFPSQLGGGETLDAVLRSDPDALLGREAALGSTSLLVKLLDAADNLSVQIHPEDADPALEEGQSGKPEAWYIIDAQPGAGLYLGFREGVTRDAVEAAIADESDVSRLLQFVPVTGGDAFVIEPGTPHAVGSGVALLEPQRVAPGARGITYRYWDWNRRYDSGGRPDPKGRPRSLHLERALYVTRWDGPREASLLAKIRHPAGAPEIDGPATIETVISRGGPLVSAVFDVRRLSGSGQIELPTASTLRSLTVLHGCVRITHEDGETTIPRGTTVALPACLDALGGSLEDAHAILCHLT